METIRLIAQAATALLVDPDMLVRWELLKLSIDVSHALGWRLSLLRCTPIVPSHCRKAPT